jgi:hypothetical protein
MVNPTLTLDAVFTDHVTTARSSRRMSHSRHRMSSKPSIKQDRPTIGKAWHFHCLKQVVNTFLTAAAIALTGSVYTGLCL